ncbi:hypothetical protein [Ruminococcus sp.]|jgi:hypothetical protein|uniref:hypothetical protein n=1 Tax=Ruminococcus sp. TaxID=41978 RepID=UPI0025EA7860|nr:hypothetical protein [Ruminococcus sp.]
MKYVKRILVLFLTAVMCFAISSPAYAFNREEHDKYMLKVLFYSFKEVDNDVSIKDEIEALECASYLTIDQYNGNGEKDLSYLQQYKVKNLPSSISQIDYTSGAYHRRATHRGWDGETTGVYNTTDRERWTIRKKILINTADKIFDFKGNTTKRDSFCALIYYTHILGDRLSDTKYYQNNDIIELGGRTDNQDITHELIHHISILFSDQNHTFKFNHVITKLDLINSRISTLLKRNNGSISNEDFAEYKGYAKDIMDVLMYNIPEMLKSEDFFRNVFY